jgi:hypothetical protein
MTREFARYAIDELGARKAEAEKRMDVVCRRRDALRKRVDVCDAVLRELSALTISLNACIHAFREEAAAEPPCEGICPPRS